MTHLTETDTFEKNVLDQNKTLKMFKVKVKQKQPLEVFFKKGYF